MNKIPSLKKEIQEMIAKHAQLFPAGMQFADIMIEDKSLQQTTATVISTLGKYDSDGNNPLPFYKHISRFTNPEIE